jgi:hypothetical protein
VDRIMMGIVKLSCQGGLAENREPRLNLRESRRGVVADDDRLADRLSAIDCIGEVC